MLTNKLKATVAVVMATLGALITALGVGDDTSLTNLDAKTWLIAIGTIAGSGALVYFVENVLGIAGGVAKSVQALATTGIASLVVALNDHHITQAELLAAIVVAVTASGLVYQIPGPEPTKVIVTPDPQV